MTVQRWQYRTEVWTQDAVSMARLDALGAEGWEVCAVQPVPGSADAGATPRYQWLFKRSVPATLEARMETKDVAPASRDVPVRSIEHGDFTVKYRAQTTPTVDIGPVPEKRGPGRPPKVAHG